MYKNSLKTPLTESEEVVYRLALRGLNLDQIAKLRSVSRATIATQIEKIMQKKLVSSRLELLAQRIEELEKELKKIRKVV